MQNLKASIWTGVGDIADTSEKSIADASSMRSRRGVPRSERRESSDAVRGAISGGIGRRGHKGVAAVAWGGAV